MSPIDRRRRRRREGNGAELGGRVAKYALLIGGVVAIVAGGRALWPAGHNHFTASTPTTLFDLYADTDFGALPDRTTFCGSVGTLGTPEHCYPMQEASGNIIDQAGSLDLTASGTRRYQVETGLPTYDGAVTWTGEHAIWFEGGNGTATDTPPAQMTMTVVFAANEGGPSTEDVLDWGYRAGAGYLIQATPNTLGVYANLGTAVARTATNSRTTDNGWHCVTIAFNGASTAGWIDGEVITWNSAWADYGSTTGAVSVYAPNSYGRYAALARVRIDHGVATLADHQALCGSLYQPARRDHPAMVAGDLSWTQAGGARCYQTSATGATCFPGGTPAYAYSAALAAAGYGARGWVVEPGRINPIATTVDCSASWTCTGTATTTTGKVAPDGSSTATEITVDTITNYAADTATAVYTSGAPLYLRFWLRCSTGSLRVRAYWSPSTSGDWSIDCSAVGGAWTMIGPEDVGGLVTETASWAAYGTGQGPLFQGLTGPVTAQIWMPTLTETDGLSVIPTGDGAAAVDTGDPVFALANDGTYWQSGDTVTTVIDEIAGAPCLVWGNPSSVFSGSGSPTCTGIINSIEVTR